MFCQTKKKNCQTEEGKTGWTGKKYVYYGGILQSVKRITQFLTQPDKTSAKDRMLWKNERRSFNEKKVTGGRICVIMIFTKKAVFVELINDAFYKIEKAAWS